MDRFDEAADAWVEKKLGTPDMLPLEKKTMKAAAAVMFRWYENKYLAEALHAAVMIERGQRENETCETCSLRARIGCPLNAYPDALEFVLKVGTGRFGCTYYRRIVEVEKEGK